MNLSIKDSNIKEKRFVAIFKDKNNKVVKTTHFGLKNPKIGTYIDHKNKEIRKNYRSRHERDLDTDDFKRAGYLSYYILWGEEDNLPDAIESYKKKFNLK
tara:strand:+ start:2508 stop:2807 length:300 start_codon:yes stop_codon:yes gene_type:complete